MNISKAQIRKLQTLKHQVAWLCNDRAAWEGFLTSCARRPATSSTQLSVQEGGRVIDELKRLVEGNSGLSTRNYVGRPGNMDDEERGAMLKKIEAILGDLGLPWSYVDGVCRNMGLAEKVSWCRPGDLHKVVAAMVKHARRHGKAGYSPKGVVRQGSAGRG